MATAAKGRAWPGDRATGLVTLTLLVAAASVQPSAGQTFVANNGLLYGSGDVRIVVDGLFREYLDEYPPLPDSLRSLFETARSPFDGVTFILATHRHGDHMHPEAIASHLCAAPNTVALVPDQTRTDVLDAADCEIEPDRVTSSLDQFERGGIGVRAVPVPHAGGARTRDVENRAYVIESAGGRFVHLGDSDLSEELASEPIDVLATPFWNIGEDRFMRLWERAGRPFLIAVHIPPGEHERLRSSYADMNLDVWVPERPLESLQSME